jgi:hypothetical protein
MAGWMHLPAAPPAHAARARRDGHRGDLQQRPHRRRRACWSARRWGLRVPQDVSVTGYNDSALAGAFEPAITSVDTPVDLHAQEVARVLLAALRDKRAHAAHAAAHGAARARQQRAGAGGSNVT